MPSAWRTQTHHDSEQIETARITRADAIRNRIEQSGTVILVILLLLGTLLRIYQLDSDLWYDEIATVLGSIRQPMLEIVTSFPSNNNHLLYSALANVSSSLFGEQPWTVRLPAVVFGIASIPALYLVGTAASSRFEALLATAIMTVSYHHIWFSQNARGYTALLFFVMMATYLLIQWLIHGKKLHVVAYAIVAALGSYSHLTMVFVVITHAAICAWVLYGQHRPLGDWRAPAAAFLLGGLLTIALYSPLLWDMASFFSETAQTQKVATPGWAIMAALQGLQIGFGALWVVALGSVIFIAGALSYLKHRPSVFFLFMLPAPVTLALGVAMGRPIFPRFIFFAIGFGLLIAIRGAVVIGEWAASQMGRDADAARYGSIMALLVTCGGMLFSLMSLPYGYSHPKQDFQGAAQFIEDTRQAGDTIATIGATASRPFQDYLGKPWPRIDSAEQLNEIRATADGLLLTFTFPDFIRKGKPELWKTIIDQCRELAAIEGTIAGGDILIYRCNTLTRHPVNQQPPRAP